MSDHILLDVNPMLGGNFKFSVVPIQGAEPYPKQMAVKITLCTGGGPFDRPIYNIIAEELPIHSPSPKNGGVK